MPYTTTAPQFFSAALPKLLGAAPAASVSGIGVVEFDLGKNGIYWVDFDARSVSRTARPPNCIVRATPADLMAVIEGRMSVGDGLLTKRLALSGEASRLARLAECLALFKTEI
ncbi:MAG: SCP2 sterol-binding domain-containing protein [Deltaproteobacteria bacterium]|nr:SCP2 sterol-binding domain-containing protein [Deltaproteobacteria bacterium]